jgi:hypothetical protein
MKFRTTSRIRRIWDSERPMVDILRVLLCFFNRERELCAQGMESWP